MMSDWQQNKSFKNIHRVLHRHFEITEYNQVFMILSEWHSSSQLATSYFPESWNNNFLLLHQRKWKVGIYELFRSHQIASLIINNSWDIDFFVEIFFLCLFFFWQAPLRAQILNLPQILRSASSLSLFSSRVQGRTQVVCIKY